MNKELLTIALAFGCIAANANTNNYDLLGRKGSKMNSPMVYKNVDYSKTKKNEQQKLNSSLENRGLAKQAVGLKGNAKAIIGVSSPKRYGFKVCESGQGCGSITPVSMKNLSLSQYFTEANKYFIPVYTDNRPIYTDHYIYDWIDGATQTGYSGYTMEEYPYDKTQNELLSHSSDEMINNLLFRNNETNSNVGVYMAEKGLPVRLNPVTDPNPSPFIIADNNAVIQSFSTTVGHEMDASRMYKLLHRFSDRSVVYSTKTSPSNPAEHRLGPQIYMGVHGGGSTMTRYNATAKNLDNYIYNNRTVEIVSAGDKGDKANKLYEKGFAVNAITVGAIDSKTGNVASYSGKSEMFGDHDFEEYVKPDIYNYTNFYMDDYLRKYSYPSSSRLPYEYKPFYDSTRTAAGVTAGMVSNMLSKNEFYRWHPEVVKAVMLNAKSAKHLNYDGLVFKNQTTLKDREYQHLSMYFIGDVNTLMKEAKCLETSQVNGLCSVFSSLYAGKKGIELTFTANLWKQFFDVDYQYIDGFKIAISWLNSGNDISNLGDIPQKYGIYIYAKKRDGLFLEAWPDNLFYNYEYGSYPYRYCTVSKLAYNRHSDNSATEYKIQIVLEDDDSRSENYGQMALGVDIMPIIYDK